MSNGGAIPTSCDPEAQQGIKRIEAKLAEIEVKLEEIETVIADIYAEVSE